MILYQGFLFLIGLVYGVITRLLYVLVTKLEKAIKLRFITIILDLLLAGLCVIAFVLIGYFFSDGLFLPFVFVSSVLGFIFASKVF